MKIKNKRNEQVIKKLEILISRLPTSFPKFQMIKNDLSHLYNQTNAKQEINFYLNQLPKQLTIINELYLENIEPFKLDALVITQYAIFILQFENINTTHLTINDNNHHSLSRLKISQANLQQWLRKRNLHDVPIYSLIVLCNLSHHHIKNYKHLSKEIILAKHLPSKLIQFHNYISQSHQNKELLIQQIIHKINTDKKRFNYNVFKRYKINRHIIKTGVRCHLCQKLNMKRINNMWVCELCHNENPFAHREALSDYFTLFKKPICKHDCKWFLNIKSSHTINQILSDEILTYDSKQKKWIHFDPIYS